MLAAFSKFDDDLKKQPELANWQENRAHKFAIRYNDQLYPMKSIIELATGTSVDSFSGGQEAVTFVKKLGFSPGAGHGANSLADRERSQHSTPRSAAPEISSFPRSYGRVLDPGRQL